MEPLEAEIQVLEGQLNLINNLITTLGENTELLQKRNALQAELHVKNQELANRQQESVYEHLSRIVGYSNELKSCIEETVDKLLDPNLQNATEPGLLLGKIQCGKTRAFVGVMGLAFDRGIDVCVVLTKSDNGLVEQTKARMEYEFRDYIGNNNIKQRCIISVNVIDANSTFTPAQINQHKNIFVVYKNKARLTNLIRLFNNTDFRNKRVLIIDDEADFVSRAFYRQKNAIKAGQIALKIDEFARIPDFCRYLQVTATPYSLFLQPDHTVSVNNGRVEPFRPRFTTLVPIHNDYIGGKHYFVLSQNNASMYSYLRHIVDDSCVNYLLYRNKDRRIYGRADTTSKLAGLRSALMSYFIASAIRELQEERLNLRRYNSSFFMHISTAIKDHNYEKLIVENILEAWKTDVTHNAGANLQGSFRNAYDDLRDSNNAGNTNGEVNIYMPTEQEVWTRFVDILTQGSYAIQIVNSSTSANLLGNDGQLKLSSPLNIFIGGFRLDRGITIDHMLGFFYGRNPQTHQADTVLQHHRMYGNRSKEDMAVTRLHTTQTLYDTMEWIDNMDHQLRKTFINAMQNPNQPIPLITIQYDPKQGIIPCGRNRLLISDLDSFKSFKRITTFGFQTDCATKINPIINDIDTKLKGYNGYRTNTPFLIDKNIIYDILHKIRSTFIYNRTKDNNSGYEWNENEMIAAIDKYIPQDGNLWCYVITNRNMSRVRKNGYFVDAPEDGNTDTPIAKSYTAQNPQRPFLMLLRENGSSNNGWRDAPFYWPSLRLPQNIESCLYCR